jgi:hypothetical protein
MGARINYIFDDGTDALTILYSHYGAYTWQEDLADALSHAKVRQGDDAYFTRMVISHLMRDAILTESGFGIYAINREELKDTSKFDAMVILDLVNNVFITEDGQATPFYQESLV